MRKQSIFNSSCLHLLYEIHEAGKKLQPNMTKFLVQHNLDNSWEERDEIWEHLGKIITGLWRQKGRELKDQVLLQINPSEFSPEQAWVVQQQLLFNRVELWKSPLKKKDLRLALPAESQQTPSKQQYTIMSDNFNYTQQTNRSLLLHA